MSKIMRIESYCDNKRTHGETQVRATHEDLVASIGTTGQRNLDLCDPCFSTFVEPFIALLAHGSAVAEDAPSGDGRAAQSLPRLCPECGHTLGSRGSLNQHLASQHRKRFRDYPNRLKSESDYQGLPHHY